MAVGRITGPLLKANLLRDGVPLAFETDLLYLDVTNGLVGIKTATPTHELTINGTTRTTNLITTEADVATFNIVGNTISSTDSQITLQPSGANAVVYQGKIVTGDLQISANTIETIATDLDLEINTLGTGQVNINSNVLVNGDLHATGAITADGDIQLGDNVNTDTITFSAEITSNLIPGLDDITSLPKYTLGSDANRWNNLYVKDVFTESFTTSTFSVNGIDLVLPQGNIIYVATAGNDTKSGTHENDPFLTVKHALSQAVSGDTVYIYPGEYLEQFPLTVPAGVTVKGTSLRSVTIKPTPSTVDKDAFLVNGETTIEDLTVSGFRFNSVDNTGYGFRFATDFTVTTRSPYVRNVTVSTQGSVTSVLDPYGFDQNDAGKGALLDGSVANVASNEATVLFHSCTFITPNQEALTATNGVRVEWLNSFTYFADKGIYAYSGTAGFASLGVKFGAEIRGIGSANIYGTYGVYGDGAGVVGYFVSHDVSYVGAGKSVANDPASRIAANEFVQINGARIYYNSADNEGNFNVGENFSINQQTGEVLFNSQTLNITSTAGVTFTEGLDSTLITPTNIDTGNISISGNTVESVTGDLTVTAANGVINLTNNTFITGNLDVTGDITLGGNIQIGDANTDTINFVGGINSNLVPATNNLYNLGSSVDDLWWKNIYLNRAEIDGVVIDNNQIATTIGNDDLTLVANGTGRIYIPSNDVQIDQNLNVTGTLYAGTFNVTNTLTANIFTTGDIEINDNYITTTLPASDLILSANGAGRVYVTGTDIEIAQTLSVTGLTTLDDLDINGNVVQYGNVEQTGNVIQTGTYYVTGDLTVGGQVTQFANIKLNNNLITTTVADSNLELVANGAGKVYIPSNNVQIDQNLTVTQDLTVTTGTTYLQDTSVTGTITQTGDINQTGTFTTSGNTQVTGNITATGYLDLPAINITGTTITTKVAGTDLNLVANGAGNVVIEGIKISNNNIQSVVTNSDITLTPQGTGSVVIDSNQSLIVPIGDNSQRPMTPTNGMIRYNNQIGRYEGYNGSYWLPMSGVQDVDGNTYITAEATPGANDNTLRFYADNSLMVTIDSTKLFAERLQTTALDIQDNTITTLVNNTDINLTTPGTGGVKIGNLRIRNNTITNTVAGAVTEFLETGSGYVKIAGTNGVVIPAGDTEFDRPSQPELGMMRYNTALQLVEIYNGVTWNSVAGTNSGISESQATDIGILTALLFG